MSAGYFLRILKPTTTRVCRQQPGRASIGDTAEARVGSGLIDLLTSPVAGSRLPLGAGILPETLACHAIAGTAAYLAIGDHEKTRHDFEWSGGEVELTWERPARRGESLIGRARVSEMRRLTLDVDVETSSEATGEVITTGQFRFVAVREGRAVRIEDSLLSFEQPAGEAAPDTLPAQPPTGSAGGAGSVRGLLRRLRGRWRRVIGRP